MVMTEKRNAENISGVSNIAYDLMSVLNNKLEGIAAMETYKQDAQGDQDVLKCFERIQEADRKDVEELKKLAHNRLGS